MKNILLSLLLCLSLTLSARALEWSDLKTAATWEQLKEIEAKIPVPATEQDVLDLCTQYRLVHSKIGVVARNGYQRDTFFTYNNFTKYLKDGQLTEAYQDKVAALQAESFYNEALDATSVAVFDAKVADAAKAELVRKVPPASFSMAFVATSDLMRKAISLKHPQAVNYTLMNYRMNQFDEKRIQASVLLVAAALRATDGDAVRANAFVKAQAEGGFAFKVSETAVPSAFQGIDVVTGSYAGIYAGLGHASSDKFKVTVIRLLLAFNRISEAETLGADLFAQAAPTSMSDAVRELANIKKAKDYNLIAANQFIADQTK